MSVGYGEVQLDRVSAKGGTARISALASVGGAFASVDIREVWVQAGPTMTAPLYVNVYASATYTASFVIPFGTVSAVMQPSWIKLPVASLSAIECVASANWEARCLWRR